MERDRHCLQKALFDGNSEISAYLYYIENNNKRLGYIIANAKDPNYIIEYGEDLFLDIASDEVNEEYGIKEKNQKIYYLGGMSYVIGGKSKKNDRKCINVSTNSMEEISEEEISEIELEEQKTLSSPPDSGTGFITSPDKYESGYDSSVSKNAKETGIM